MTREAEERFIKALVKFNAVEVAGYAKILGVRLANVDGDKVIARDGYEILCDIVDAWRKAKRKPRRELLHAAEVIARDHCNEVVVTEEVDNGTDTADKQE